jgi:hypothetical protein
MKKLYNLGIYASAMIAVATLGLGCSALLQETAAKTSLPVLTGSASTNDPVAVAYEKLALHINAEYNPTSSQPLIASLGGALLALTSAASGWYARHHTAQGEIKSALNTPPPAPPAT